jgi:SagB-type dehydrogenase family enzyme
VTDVDLDPRAHVRRSSCLSVRWEEKNLVVENFLTGSVSVLPAIVVPMLHELVEAISIEALIKRWEAVPDRQTLIKQLIERDLLLVEGSDVAQKESHIRATWEWGHSARYFHYATNVRQFEWRPEIQRKELSARAVNRPPPLPYKDYPGKPAIPLGSNDFAARREEFWDLLRTRRTCRNFQRGEIPFQSFSDLLLWTWGKLDEISDPSLGTSLLKTSPSGGARHPIEVYPVVLSVTDIESGIYHYSVRDHALILLQRGLFREFAVELCSDQEWVGDAAAVFFMTAVVERSMWKYRDAHAYRVLHLDAGHLGQTFHLAATALGLAPFTTAATRNLMVEKALGLDGVSEIVLYAAAVGIANSQRSEEASTSD